MRVTLLHMPQNYATSSGFYWTCIYLPCAILFSTAHAPSKGIFPTVLFLTPIILLPGLLSPERLENQFFLPTQGLLRDKVPQVEDETVPRSLWMQQFPSKSGLTPNSAS